MVSGAGTALIAAVSLLHQGALESCSVNRISQGPFQISTFLDQGGGHAVAIRFRIPRSNISPRYEGSAIDGPSINIEYEVPLSHNRGRDLSFMGFERLFTRPRFTIRSMTMRCGRDVVLIGDVARQPFPLTGVFEQDSHLRSDACIAALRGFGTYSLEFAEVEGEGRTVRIAGRAAFASAMGRAERLARRGLARARSGRCQLDPPPMVPF